MTPIDKDLRALALAATPGPWRYQEQSDAYTHIVRAGESRFICQLSQTGKQSEANSRFIAAANPQTVIGLLDRIEALRTALKPFVLENEMINKLEEMGLKYDHEYTMDIDITAFRKAGETDA